MRSDKTQTTNMNTRQKVTAAILVIVVIVIVWQVIGLFRGGKSAPAAITPAATTAKTPMAHAPTPQNATPQPAQLAAPQPVMSEREMQLMRLQEETQAKYVAALNELQMLKVAKEIAETNQAISKAKLETVTAEKGIVNLLSPQVPVGPADYARGLVNPVTSGNVVRPGTTTTTTTTQTPAQVNYTVISVSQLQYKWSAVLGYQGRLYSVSTGDILPADGSKVVSIDRTGVVLEKEGDKKKISLVPII